MLLIAYVACLPNEVTQVANEVAYVTYAMCSIRSGRQPCMVVQRDASFGEVRESYTLVA